MARSPEDLANLALSYLVRGTIRSLDSDEPEAVQTKQHMDFAKESVIQEYDWPECRVIAPLVQVNQDFLRGWNFAYNEPSDLAKIWMVTDGSTRVQAVPYERGMSADLTSDRSYIFTNQGAAYIRYGSTRVSVGRFGADVFDLIAIKLAITACLPITKDLKLQERLLNLYAKRLNTVKTSVANAEPEIIDQEFTPESVRVRSE